MTGPVGEPSAGTHNRISGNVHGNAVQAGQINGGVHFHVNHHTVPPPPPVPVPHFATVAVRTGPTKRAQAVKFLGRWFVALLPVFLAAGAVSELGTLIVGARPFPLRMGAGLALVLPLLLLGLWVSGQATGRKFRGAATWFLDLATPRRLAELPAHSLLWFAAACTVVFLFGTVMEARPPKPGQAETDGLPALMFFAFLSALAWRQWLRHKAQPVA